ncbi:MAG TPA: hypothetical protein VFC14_09190 [Burkholderiales bacterium]|nr:hypothetical protein [Burkholderiales bacterium]
MSETRIVNKLVLVACIAVSLAAGSVLAFAAEKKAEAKKGEAKKGPPGKRERIDCMVGTEDRQARIAIEAVGGKIQNFAYYGKTKPRTCSMDVKRGDSYSKWEDTGNHTVVTLMEETGAFLIDQDKSRFHFIFRDIDRMRYCGMHGKINGSLTVTRGKNTCTVERLYIDTADIEEAEKEAEKKEAEKKEVEKKEVETKEAEKKIN